MIQKKRGYLLCRCISINIMFIATWINVGYLPISADVSRLPYFRFPSSRLTKLNVKQVKIFFIYSTVRPFLFSSNEFPSYMSITLVSDPKTYHHLLKRPKLKNKIIAFLSFGTKTLKLVQTRMPRNQWCNCSVQRTLRRLTIFLIFT